MRIFVIIPAFMLLAAVPLRAFAQEDATLDAINKQKEMRQLQWQQHEDERRAYWHQQADALKSSITDNHDEAQTQAVQESYEDEGVLARSDDDDAGAADGEGGGAKATSKLRAKWNDWRAQHNGSLGAEARSHIGHTGEDVQNAKAIAADKYSRWKAGHQGVVDNVKSNVDSWKNGHKEEIDQVRHEAGDLTQTAKQKWEDWRASHAH